jgi:AraC family transcriptional activator of pobA
MPKTLPLFTIEQTVNTYKYLFKPEPTFGMDFFAPDFVAKEIVLLLDDKAPSHGIPLRFDYYALFLRLKGETKRSVNQYCYRIKPQSLQLVHPGSLYSFMDTTATSKTYVLLFDKAFIETENLQTDLLEPLLDFHRRHPQDAVLDTSQYVQALALYEQLSDELRNKREGYRNIAKMVINQLLFLLQRFKLTSDLYKARTRSEQISADFLLLIEENFCQVRSVKGYAELLDITPKHLSETVHATLNRPALFCIHNRIVKEIQYLLCFSELSIKQIAYALNFETSSQLGRFFKHYEGTSPKAYRLKNRFFQQ